MTSDFAQLLEYQYLTNRNLLFALHKTPHPEAFRLLSHIVNAQQIWLARLKNENTEQQVWTEETSIELLAARIQQDYQDWQAYVAKATEAEWETRISYTNSKGDPYENRRMDIFRHVLNHGTHHRGQICLLLRQAGHTPPITDYVFHLRSLGL